MNPLHNQYLIILLLALSSFIFTGCATSLTSTTDARAYDVGEVQATVVYQASVHTNVLGGFIEAAQSADDEFDRDSNKPISEESFRSWLDAVLIASLFRPATGPEISVRTGITDNVLEGMDLSLIHI